MGQPGTTIGADSDERSMRRHEVEWLVLGTVTVAALVLGTVGYAHLDLPGGNLSTADSLYASLQLFVLESGSLRSPMPAALEIARWLAPAVTFYAGARAAALLFRDQVERMRMRLGLRDHVVVAGLGDKGYAIAVALRRSGRRVVAIERDERNPAVAGCRRRDISVLIGDAADVALLARVRLDRASHMIVVTGDDRRNVDIAFKAQRPPERVPLTAVVHLDDFVLWRLLQAEAVAKRGRLGVRLDFFNLRDAAARAMLDTHPPFAPAESGDKRAPHVLVVSSDRLGESVILRAAGLWQSEATAGEDLLVTLAGPGAGSTLALLAAREPALERVCVAEALDLQPASIGVAIAPDGTTPGGSRPVTAAYVCLDSEAEAVAVALALNARPALANVRVVVVVSDEHSGISLALGSEDVEEVKTFGTIARTLNDDLLAHGASEALARAKHEHYVECERQRGTPAEGNASMAAWSELEPALKESNRRFADSVGEKLELAGCAIAPAPLVDPANPGFAFTEAEVEELARSEHDRWCRDLEADGWKFGRVKDPVGKRHPKLLAWEELTEEDRDKDREPVALLPNMLARAGFQIERAAPPSFVTRIERTRAAAAIEDELARRDG